MVRITEDLIRKRAEHNELMVRVNLQFDSATDRPSVRIYLNPQLFSDLLRNQIFRNHEILKLNYNKLR